jgi:hypothetical protein
VGIGERTVVWVDIDTWKIEKMALENEPGTGDRMRDKRSVRFGSYRVMES